MRPQLWYVPQEPVVSMVVLQAAPRAGCVRGPLQPVFFLFFPFWAVIPLICSPGAGIKLPDRGREKRKLLQNILCRCAALFLFRDRCQIDARLILISSPLFGTFSSVIVIRAPLIGPQTPNLDKLASGKWVSWLVSHNFGFRLFYYGT